MLNTIFDISMLDISVKYNVEPLYGLKETPCYVIILNTGQLYIQMISAW